MPFHWKLLEASLLHVKYLNCNNLLIGESQTVYTPFLHAIPLDIPSINVLHVKYLSCNRFSYMIQVSFQVLVQSSAVERESTHT